MLNEASLSYRRPGSSRNGGLDDLVVEASARQQPRRRGAGTTSRDDPLGPHTFRLDVGQSRVDEVARKSLCFEVEPNRRIAFPAARECLSAIRCEPRLVEDAVVPKARQHTVGFRSIDPGALESLAQAAFGEVASRERLRCDVEGAHLSRGNLGRLLDLLRRRLGLVLR